MYRTHNCGELRESHANQTVTLAGWLHNIRDMGSVIFFVMRDFFGITQVVASAEEMKQAVRAIPRESTLSVTGKVVMRSDPNAALPTGLIEIVPESISPIGLCTELLPFEVSASTEAREDLRLKYRFLDLRNPVNKDKIILRSRIISALRRKMTERGFFEFQTPILTSSSPEGARDYLVPSRVHPGKFYALPQAPQQFKQLLMVSGFDKYFQIAPCFRDEDARADRSPGEFYQLDMEMSFASQEDVFAVMEGVLPEIFREFTDWKVDGAPFVRIPFTEAMDKYCSDKPDLRNPLLVTDVSAVFAGTSIKFLEGKTVKAIPYDSFDKPRSFFDNLTAFATLNGAKGLSWIKVNPDGTLMGTIAKLLSETEAAALKQILKLKAGSIAILLADEKAACTKLTGLVRNEMGRALDIVQQNVYRFCWIVDFPMYERDEETGEIGFSHNPFSMPQGGMDALKNKNPLDIFAYQYDIVCNGIELSSGAVRNHDPEMMIKAFELAGYGEDVVKSKFPALFNAFKFGAPPHAGIAPGVDRIVMLIAGEPNIREVIAFPMNKNAQDLLMGAPGEVTQKQLDDVSIAINIKKKQ